MTVYAYRIIMVRRVVPANCPNYTCLEVNLVRREAGFWCTESRQRPIHYPSTHDSGGWTEYGRREGGGGGWANVLLLAHFAHSRRFTV